VKGGKGTKKKKGEKEERKGGKKKEKKEKGKGRKKKKKKKKGDVHLREESAIRKSRRVQTKGTLSTTSQSTAANAQR